MTAVTYAPSTLLSDMPPVPPFPFLELPPELRNWIYELAFENSTTTVSSKIYKPRVTRINSSGNKGAGLPNLLHASSQLRSESAFIFYSSTNFIANSQHELLDWLEALDPKCKFAIKHLCLRGHYAYLGRKEDWLQKDLETDKRDFARRMAKRRVEFDTSLITFEIWQQGDEEKAWPKD